MGQVNGNIKILSKFISYLCCISFTFNAAGSECSSRVQPIQKGTPAQCDGYLFSDQAESEAYKATRLAELQKEENEILQKRLALYTKQSEVLAKELSQKKNTEDLLRIGAFVLGAVLTGIISSNVR